MKSVLVSVVSAGLLPGVVAAQRHVRPSAIASRVASQLPWQPDFASAIAAAKRSGRKILWYVPTVPRSPMDRRNIVDLYMRAGFFSDPDLVALLRHFVLLDRVPSPGLAKRFDLVPFRFIEPGFLVLDAAGNVEARAHALTTFAPAWFAHELAPFLPPEAKAAGDVPSVTAVRRERLFGDPDRARKLLAKLEKTSPGAAIEGAMLALGMGRPGAAIGLLEPLGPEPRAGFLRGVCLWLQNRQADARTAWRAVAKAAGGGPLAWRAAAEAEGFGPVARGFYTYRDLPSGWDSKAVSGTTVPRTNDDVAMLRRRSVEFLLSMQSRNGGFEDSNYDFGGLDSVPNVNVAVTAICSWALLEARDVDPQRCDAAVARGLRYALDDTHLNPKDRDEWLWARIYPIHLVVAVLESKVEIGDFERPRLIAELGRLVAAAFGRQGADGSFRHEYSNPFASAAMLMAYDAAARFGVEAPRKSLTRAFAALERCRAGRGAFSYSQVRGRRSSRATVAASAGRMPLCETALWTGGRSSRDRVVAAMRAAFAHHEQLESTRKYDDHANRLHYGGFFYWFDMLGRRFAVERLGAAGKEFRVKQRAMILEIPEVDGCFVDSHELGRSYGTAMALLCLGK